ncbi:hypothetical protein HX810_09720 [Pseudomonas salomonii]|uniref:Uncharacterized protein n=1 Tax=Pseudomonas salomonii TaxID=191391 RepID=A0A7Y8GCV4_9PSED|nr:hypothetical protein [Pseudomonas salomonii]NWF07940.1 hypothetical protein [Pseudomonas salomonii]
MAKPIKGDSAEQSAPPVVAQVKYRDTVYRTRTLILQGGRALPVKAFTVAVNQDDEQALAYLAAHPDLELIQE